MLSLLILFRFMCAFVFVQVATHWTHANATRVRAASHYICICVRTHIFIIQN